MPKVNEKLKTKFNFKRIQTLHDTNINIVSSPTELNLRIQGLDFVSRMKILNQNIWEMRHMGAGQYFDLAKDALKYAIDNQNNISIVELALAYLNLGNTAWSRSDPNVAFDSLQKAQRLYRSIADIPKAGFAEAIMANLYSQKGEYENAFAIIYRVMDEMKEENEYEVLGLAELSAGSFHFDLESYKDAFDYFNRSSKSFAKINDEIGLARSTNNAGMALQKQGKNKEGLEYCERALKIYERLDQDQGKAKAKRDIGKILESQGSNEEALIYFKDSLKIREQALKSKSSGVDGIITCLMDIGSLLVHMDRLEEAKEYLSNSLLLSQSHESVPKIIKIHKRLSEAYKKEGDFESALKHLEKNHDLKKEMLGQETANKIKMMQTRYALDLAQKETELEKTKHDELTLAYDKINVINKNITDSLKYAKRIQNSFLPSKQRFKLTYPESFILNLPKDIVSGDFYWTTQKNGFHLLAVADCSGHGVPGAFMSMVGISLLNQIVNERGVLQPGKILNQLNLALINNLNQTFEEASGEGIDISLCVFDPNFSQVVYSGAKRPMYYLKNGLIEEIKGTPSSIGFDPYTDFSERTTRLDLHDIDQIFLATDGYSDQFSGSNGKKLMISKFKELIKSQAESTCEAQETFLKDYFYSWMGKEPQTDDVLVLGVKLVK